MPTVHETVYPRLKSVPTRRELVDLYTPTEGELELAERSSKGEPARLAFLVLLKTFQRLGYFIALRDVPRGIVEHIGHDRGMLIVPEAADYDDSGTRRRHVKIIRQYLRVKSFDETGQVILSTAVRLAAERMEDLADITNVAIEELIRESFELPGFSTLHKEAKRGRAEVNRTLYRRVSDAIGTDGQSRIDLLLAEPDSESRKTRWDALKQDAQSPTLTHVRDLLERQRWLALERPTVPLNTLLPEVKLRQFALEAKSLDAARMLEMAPQKRYTLAATLIELQNARVLDDLAEMFIKRMMRTHRHGRETDRSFPENDAIRIEHGEPVLAKVPRKKTPARLAWFEATIRKEMPQTPILDALADTENLLNWTRFFGPLSGLDTKLENPAERYVLASFCYGCNLGPSQTARSVQGTDRRQIAWLNQRHITEDALDEAITTIINAYNNFSLPRLWGSGKHASADGTRWDLYEQNLLSEYHIRYGGYGGIGYYHVSDTYIALFSHFIPCGVWEAVYILDGLLKNESDIQPDVLHADTQGQSEPVFALAHLLGIELMPRIRNWKSLDFCRPDSKARYDHIDSLFTENVDWNLIETHLPDMLRVVLSIKAGRISASTILRRLGTYSRKNRLYQAFCELGRVIRTGFLLRYISDSQLRSTIQGATNKSEALNRFLKWTFFGGEGIIAENSRDEQRKAIKYNHLVANCLIFHNLCSLTRLVQDLEQRGETVPEDAIAAISPYLTEHINRFGDYTLNLARKPPQPDYGYTLRRAASAA
jgi:TnpA family transposase